MQNKFDFFEKVKVTHPSKEYKKINNRIGVILGMSQDNEEDWGYAVTIDNICWDIAEKYLVSTGKFAKREDFYDGDSIIFKVNEKGEGYID